LKKMDSRVISAFTRIFDALCPAMTGDGVGGAREIGHVRKIASPLLSTMSLRATTRHWNKTRSPSGHISVQMMSPGKTGRENRASMLFNRSGR
jgi:hypothetical protein